MQCISLHIGIIPCSRAYLILLKEVDIHIKILLGSITPCEERHHLLQGILVRRRNCVILDHDTLEIL